MTVKIFELAKEVDMGALDLVEKLKAEGFSVRNHMSTLTDEEVEKVRVLLTPPEDEKKPAAKKKVAKKKAKKVTKKADGKSSAAEEKSASAASEAKPKKTTKKKKTVLIRKSAQDETADSDLDLSAEASSQGTTKARLDSEGEQNSSGREADDTAADSKSVGLRVVSQAKREAAGQDQGEGEKESSTGDEKTLFKEKVHRFTPVYVPDEEEREELRLKKKAATVDSEDESEEDDDKKKTEKKRLGGLASMMSGKKAVMSKSLALQQTRADTELKSYAALSSLGRPIYTQIKKKRAYLGPSKETQITEVKDSKRVIHLKGGGTITGIAHLLSVKVEDLIDQALDLNLLLRPNDYVGIKLAGSLAAIFGYRVEDRAFDEEKVIGKKQVSDKELEKYPLRDPIITIMGHVDHGKTTLLDYIRKAQVAEGEAGGITQHIGAYSVSARNKTLTFLDTPGHAAFASMRQRGADVTDIVVLVVAADDGVMPQTKESIRFCQNANKPIIVAVNKMDKEQANPDRVKSELAELGITAEDWGGDVQFVPISALKGDGVDDLLDSIAIQAELMELRANSKGAAEGVVIESKVEPGRGPIATILVQTGTLKKGDSLVVGETYGRARSLTDHKGGQLNQAGPSIPVQILGLREAPRPGDMMNVLKNEREAKKVSENRINERLIIESAPQKKQVSLEDFFAEAAQGETKTLNLIIRSDVQGSYEAIKQALENLGNAEVSVKIVGGGVGPISDSDVQLADSASGIIIGFNMRPVTTARKLAEQKGIEVKTYSIIYELINEVKLALEGLLEPETYEKYIGRAEVKETFSVPKIGVIAGSQVIDGSIKVGCQIRLLREGKILFDGKLSSLRRFKDDVKEVKSGYECGIGLQNFNDIKVGDLFEAYLMEERKRSLDEANVSTGASPEGQDSAHQSL